MGLGQESLRDGPQELAPSLPTWLLGRAGGPAEDGGTAGTCVPTGAHGPAWVLLAERRVSLPCAAWAAPASPCHCSQPHSGSSNSPSARLHEGCFALTLLLHGVGGLSALTGHTS